MVSATCICYLYNNSISTRALVFLPFVGICYGYGRHRQVGIGRKVPSTVTSALDKELGRLFHIDTSAGTWGVLILRPLLRNESSLHLIHNSKNRVI